MNLINKGKELNTDQPDINLQEGDDGQFILTINSDKLEINLGLSRTAIQTLALQFAPHIPVSHNILKQTAPAGSAGPFREPALILKHLDNRSMAFLMREISSVSLINFIWYMNDAELVKLMLNNCSKRARELIIRDLDFSWLGKDPDKAKEFEAVKGRKAIIDVMETYYKLANSGEIEDLQGVQHGA